MDPISKLILPCDQPILNRDHVTLTPLPEWASAPLIDAIIMKI